VSATSPVMAAGPAAQYLTFLLAGDEYAVSILKVKEIIEYQAPTRVPSTPPWIRGVINLRGSVVPVVDLGLKFGLAPGDVTRLTCIVIVEVSIEDRPTVMGVLADAVSQVVAVAASDVEAPPCFGTRVRVDYLLGMARGGRGFVLLLDIDRVLAATEILAAVQDAEPEPAPGEDTPGDLNG
jgi:purine-binding chemotaxis protein CheW